MKVKLSSLSNNDKSKIVTIEGCFTLIKRLTDLGLTKDCVVEMKNNFGRGPILIIVRGTELALGRIIAEKVWVEKT